VGVDPVFGIAGGVIFIVIGIAYLTLGPTGGQIVGVVLIVPFVAWLGVVLRRRRERGS
jgi:hypothetical protein